MSAAWTDAQLAELRRVYTEERERRVHGAVSRTAKQLGMPVSRVEHKLHRLPDWEELKQAAPEAPAAVDPTDERVRTLERQLLSVRDQLREVKAKVRKDDRAHGIIGDLRDVLVDTIEPMSMPEMPEYKPRSSGGLVDAVVMLSDQHSDRRVSSAGTWGLEQYGWEEFRCRLWEWSKMVKRYSTTHLPNYKFDTLWVWHLGDAVNGDIHNMKHKNEWSNSLRAAIATGDAQAQALAYLASAFKRIVVVCVSGNHGRLTKQIEYEDPFDNFDYLVAETMRARLAGTPLESKIEIITPHAWTAYVRVRGHLWSLNHGHGVIGTWGIPWYGFERREGRVQRLVGQLNERIDYFAYGHFHTPLTRPAGQGKALHAGAWFLTDPYALNKLSAGNEPEQQMIVCSERFGRQIEIPIMVRDLEKEEAMRRGEWTPPFGVPGPERGIIVEQAEAVMRELPAIT